MDIAGVSVSAIKGDATPGSRASDAASILVQKKSMQMQAENILGLAESVSNVSDVKATSGPGQIIDIKV